MHCSVWRFRGDPDALERGYRAVMEQVPASNHVLHAAARTPDGLLIFDTCPSEEATFQYSMPSAPPVSCSIFQPKSGTVFHNPLVRSLTIEADRPARFSTSSDWV